MSVENVTFFFRLVPNFSKSFIYEYFLCHLREISLLISKIEKDAKWYYYLHPFRITPTFY